MTKVATTILLSLVFLNTYAGGFQVVLQGVRQTAMGNNGSALADASNAFYNPASVGFIEGSAVTVGVNFIDSNVDYVGEGPSFNQASTDNPLSTPFYLSAMFGVGEEKKLKVGLSVTTPYGSSVKWEDGWAGSQFLKEISLAAIFIQPTVAYRINDMVSVGAGFQYVIGAVNLKRITPLPVNGVNASTELDGEASGIGFNVGVNIRPMENLSIGLAYRSKVDAKVEEGTATISNIPTLQGVPGQRLAAAFPTARDGGVNTKFKVTLPLPAVATLGLAYEVNEDLTLVADLRYNFWSAYKELKFEFNDPIGGSNVSASPRKYENAIAVGLGGEYKMESLRLRLGGYFDQTPAPDGYMTAETPDANTTYLSGGIGYVINDNIHIDLSLLYGIRAERENTPVWALPDGTEVAPGTALANPVGPAGKFAARIFIPAISVSYTFGQ